MSCLWVSAQVCSEENLFWLTELLRREPHLQITLSCEGSTSPKQPNDQCEMESKLSGVLARLGMKPNLKGYQYLRTAVLTGWHDRAELEGVTKRLYPAVGKKHGTAGAKVEHAIRHAIESGWDRGNYGDQERIFGYHAGKGKRPTNSEFIVRMIDYLDNDNGLLYS